MTQLTQPIRTRIAPSPTGVLHVGTARTALINWLFTKQLGGKFILRIDDTDKERSTSAFEEDIRNGLFELGLKWDEEYRQSSRSTLYKKHLTTLLEKGVIFYCPHESGEGEFGVPHVCSERNSNSTKGILRFKNDTEELITFTDMIRGDVQVDPKTLGDFSVARSIEHPLFIFATTIDDADLQISHVIRGEDHISNVPKQILIQRALDMSEPIWAHLPLILGTDRSKLSKRHGATALTTYFTEGYLPDALINFLALLGWHPKNEQEIFSPDELVSAFELDRMQKGGAIYDKEKLNWINKQHLAKKDSVDLLPLITPRLIKAELLIEQSPDILQTQQGVMFSKEQLLRLIDIEKQRTTTLTDFTTTTGYFFLSPEYPAELLLWKGKQEPAVARNKLEQVHSLLEGVSENEFTTEALTTIIMPLAEQEGRGDTLWPLRVALSGERASAGPMEIMEVIGKTESLSRITHAITLLQK